MNLLELPCEATGNQGLLRLGEAGLALDGWPRRAYGATAAGTSSWAFVPRISTRRRRECRRSPLLLNVRIDAVEPLGAETLLLLTLSATGQECTARVGLETLRLPRGVMRLDSLVGPRRAAARVHADAPASTAASLPWFRLRRRGLPPMAQANGQGR